MIWKGRFALTIQQIKEEKTRLFNDTYNLVKEIYKRNNVGGLLHIVLDDGNLKDCHIKWCIDEIKSSNSDDKELYLQCAHNLLKMTPMQRLKLYRADYSV